MPTVIAVTAWKGFGYTLTLLAAAVLNISQSLYEAAEMDGGRRSSEICAYYGSGNMAYHQFLYCHHDHRCNADV